MPIARKDNDNGKRSGVTKWALELVTSEFARSIFHEMK
jgi:hypothetical protein